MKNINLSLALFAFALTSCGPMGFVTSGPNPFNITPSRQPAILSPTPIFIFPTTSATLPLPPSLTPTLTATLGPSPTITETPTITLTPSTTPTATATAIPVEIGLLGCDTGFDVTHGMGEVTNAYVIISNYSAPDLTNMCTTLAAADEDRSHPDKTRCVPNLPAGFRVALKLTIDTTFRADTIVQVNVVSDQGFAASAGGLACNTIGAFKPADEIIGIIQANP